jgi:hypothetical protein
MLLTATTYGIGVKWMSMEHWWDDTDRGKPKYLEENLSHFHFFHKKNSTQTWNQIQASAVIGQQLYEQ